MLFVHSYLGKGSEDCDLKGLEHTVIPIQGVSVPSETVVFDEDPSRYTPLRCNGKNPLFDRLSRANSTSETNPRGERKADAEQRRKRQQRKANVPPQAPGVAEAPKRATPSEEGTFWEGPALVFSGVASAHKRKSPGTVQTGFFEVVRPRFSGPCNSADFRPITAAEVGTGGFTHPSSTASTWPQSSPSSSTRSCTASPCLCVLRAACWEVLSALRYVGTALRELYIAAPINCFVRTLACILLLLVLLMNVLVWRNDGCVLYYTPCACSTCLSAHILCCAVSVCTLCQLRAVGYWRLLVGVATLCQHVAVTATECNAAAVAGHTRRSGSVTEWMLVEGVSGATVHVVAATMMQLGAAGWFGNF